MSHGAAPYMDPNDGGLPPTVPPPDWIANASCYTPKLLDDKRYLRVRVKSRVKVLNLLKFNFIVSLIR